MTMENTTDTKLPASPPLPAPAGSASDAEWGRALWDWLREMLPDAGCCLEFDTDDLMRLAEKHGRAKRIIFNPEIHGFVDAEPGDEIWWWGDDLMQNDRGQARRDNPKL